MRTIAVKAPKEVKVVSESEHQEDYYKGFRSAVVLVWMFCNLALAAVVLSAGGLETVKVGKDSTNGPQRSTIYMAVVLWSVAALSLFRFCGAVWFLIVRLVSLASLLVLPLTILTCHSFVAFERASVVFSGGTFVLKRRLTNELECFFTVSAYNTCIIVRALDNDGKRYQKMYQN